MERKQAERGVALAMALLVMVLITILLAAGFAAMSSERRVNANDEVALDAFTMAETGLENFMANRATYGFTAAPPAVIESTRVTQGSGYVDVVLSQVRADTVAQRWGYVLRAHAENQVAALSGTPQGERTVAEYVLWQPAKMTVLAGFTSLSGLQKNGNSGSLSGTDSCGKAPNVAGVAVPTIPGYIGPPGPVSGNPPIQYLGTPSQATTAAGINWPAIVNGTAPIQPDITVPPSSFPSFADPNSWPVVMVVGNFTLPYAGRGTLIVTGDLTVSGSNMWDGVVLAGGNLISNGNNVVEGAVVTGLNVELGQSVSMASVGNGTKTYQYNSCNVARAMAKTAHLIGVTNAWVDNWPTY
jgi:hypothetical protein